MVTLNFSGFLDDNAQSTIELVTHINICINNLCSDFFQTLPGIIKWSKITRSKFQNCLKSFDVYYIFIYGLKGRRQDMHNLYQLIITEVLK